MSKVSVFLMCFIYFFKDSVGAVNVGLMVFVMVQF